jgi:hypothetical protein
MASTVASANFIAGMPKSIAEDLANAWALAGHGDAAR